MPHDSRPGGQRTVAAILATQGLVALVVLATQSPRLALVASSFAASCLATRTRRVTPAAVWLLTLACVTALVLGN
jgi:uncharacterized protein YgbK (DUF1537 family)